jgi:hypothetical protein
MLGNRVIGGSMMNPIFPRCALAAWCLLAVAWLDASAQGDAAGEKIRMVVEKNKDSIVKVKFTVKRSSRSGDRESTRTATGVLISNDGLVLFSARALASYGSLLGIRSAPEEKTSDFKIVLPDGKEIAAKLLAQDKELDLAFVKAAPSKDAKFSPLDLSQNAAAQLGEQVIAINRLSEGRDFAPAFDLSRVNAVVTKPFAYYMFDDMSYGPGLPVFTLEGKLIGFILAPEPAGAPGGLAERLTPVLIPVDQIMPSVDSVKDAVVKETDEKPK